MITTPVKLWRRHENVASHIGRTGVILNWTIVRIPPKMFHHEAPYPVVIIEFENKERMIGQLVDWEEKNLKKGQKVIAVIRRTFTGDTEGIIAYNIKFKPL